MRVKPRERDALNRAYFAGLTPLWSSLELLDFMIIQFDTIVSILIGGFITWVAAHWYYVRAAREMEAETKALKNLHRISLQAMENAGMVKLNRNLAGDIVGMVHDMSSHVVATSCATAECSILNKIEESDDSK